ncbi:MAG: hypothetical protein ABJN22_14695 [Litorimonas sp.]
MARPTKGKIKPNQKYLKEWDVFQRDHPSKKPILLPLTVSIEDGVIARDRIKSGDIAKMRDRLMKDFCKHCDNPGGYLEDRYCARDFETMLDDYIKFFEDDNNQGPRPASPLDFNINRPVWMLFQLPRENWKFSEGQQFSTENDHDDFGRNFEKITTLHDNDILVLANHCRSKPDNLKFNLHVTISQKENGKILQTPIIIDPGSSNGTRGGGGQQGLP